MPFVVRIVCRLRSAKCILKLDDVYPEILIATGMASPHNLGVRILGYMTKRLYLGVDRIIVVGRDMATISPKKTWAFT